MAETKLSLKLLINSQTNSILFAEANKDTVDFLSHLLSLPISTVIKLLHEKGMVGCLANVYESIETANVTTYIQSGQSKDSFLKIIGLPAVTKSGPVSLMILDQSIENILFYKCTSCSNSGYSNDQRVNCPLCNRKMTYGMKYVAPTVVGERPNEGGIVRGVATYMITDDLVVKPMCAVSSPVLMNMFNVKDISVLKEKEVHMGTNEALKLLKASLQSKNVLTEVFEEQLKEDLEDDLEGLLTF